MIRPRCAGRSRAPVLLLRRLRVTGSGGSLLALVQIVDVVPCESLAPIKYRAKCTVLRGSSILRYARLLQDERMVTGASSRN